LPGSPRVFCESRAEFAVATHDQDQTGTASNRTAQAGMSKYAEGGADRGIETAQDPIRTWDPRVVTKSGAPINGTIDGYRGEEQKSSIDQKKESYADSAD